MLFGVLLTVAAYAGVTEKAKLYRSISGDKQATLLLVPYSGQQYLLQFNGFEHRFDGKTLLYTKKFKQQQTGSGDYYQLAGTGVVHFSVTGKKTLVAGTIKEYAEVHFAKKLPVRMLFSKNIHEPAATGRFCTQ